MSGVGFQYFGTLGSCCCTHENFLNGYFHLRFLFSIAVGKGVKATEDNVGLNTITLAGPTFHSPLTTYRIPSEVITTLFIVPSLL